MTSKLHGPDDGSADDDFADKLDARCAQHRAHRSVRAPDRRPVAHDTGEMAGAAVTRPGAVKRRWQPPRPPRKTRGEHSGTRSDDSALLDHLKQHALGVADMTATQVRAAEIVLKRAKTADQPENPAVLPTMSAEPLSEEEWQERYVQKHPRGGLSEAKYF